MKKFLLLASMVMAGGAVQAQITLETRYSIPLEAYKLSTGDVKYGGYNAVTGQYRIYNQNHSLLRSVSVPSFAYVDGDYFLSDRLFNTTPDLEFALVTQAVVNGPFKFQVFSELGATLLSVDSCSYARVYNTPTGTKLFASVSGGNVQGTKVFGLGGTLTALRSLSAADGEMAQAYPNPAVSEIRLPYKVQPGKTAQLIIRDAVGRQVGSYTVDQAFDHLLLDTRPLPSGVYFYTVGSGPARRFSVQ